jgi:hypothetical protein
LLARWNALILTVAAASAAAFAALAGARFFHW